jgi:MFS family permease
MIYKLRLPHYFSRAIHREMGELYVSTTIANFGTALVMLFEPIFLYSVLGFSIEQVLLFFAVVYALYIVLMPLGAKIISRIGYDKSIFASIPFQILYWVFIFGAQDNFALIYFAPLAFAIEKSLFWPAFHGIVAQFANRGQQGREFSVLYAIVHLMQIIGPLIGGLIAQRYGLQAAFVVASVVYFCSFIPLFTRSKIFTPPQYRFHDTWEMYKKYPTKFLGYLGFGEELIVLTIWPIFIYIVVKDYQGTGIIVTIASFVAAILALYIGKYTDKHNKRLMIKVGSFIYVLVWLARIVAGSKFGVFIIDSLSRTSKELVSIPLSTLTYERAEATDILPYVVFAEQSLAIAKFLAAVIGIIVFALTGSFIALFIAAGVFTLLYMFI